MTGYQKTNKHTKDNKRVIYTKDKSKTEYVKHNGIFITLSHYEKLINERNTTSKKST